MGPKVISSGPNFSLDASDRDYTIPGLYGTIGEQQDETHYDQRIDSDGEEDDGDGRIRFPRDKLYGREVEVKRLTEVYRGCHKGRRAVFLDGLSGTGKSALVDQFVRQVSPSDKKPLVGSGKFEQYCESSPLGALSDSVSEIANQLLKQTNDLTINAVRKSLQKCGLGPTDDDCVVLIGVFPGLEPLLRYKEEDPTTETAPANTNATKNPTAAVGKLDIARLKIVFANFILALGRKQDRPIVMFLDDLQWADEASLEILTALLLHKPLQNFLFIGSHRSNEVQGQDHPYAKTMAAIQQGLSVAGAVQRIELSGLLPQDVASFVADCIHREIDDVQPIVQLLYKKTLGNIFFVMQALEEMVRTNLLYYDIICYEWQWNLEKDNQAQLDNFVSRDVCDMIKSKIEDHLTPECQRALVMMAYTQNTISAHTLLALLQADDNGTTNELKQVLKLLDEAAEEGLLLATETPNEYTFAHDLIQEAAHSSVLEGEEQDRLLVQIAKVLVDRADMDHHGGEEWMLFVAVRHLNSVPKKRIDPLESLAKLNLRVANLATSKASLAQAVQLLRSGLTCLEPKTRWDKDLYGFTLDLFDRLIDTEFLLGNYERAEAATEEVLQNATSLRDKTNAHINLVNIAALKNNRNYEAGVRKGLEILNIYGERIPFSPSKTNLFWERLKLKFVRGNRSLMQLVDMPVMADDSVIKLLELTLKYEYMGSVSPRLSKMIMARALRRSFSQGICWDLALLALSYGVASNKADRQRHANLYASLAAELQKLFPEALKGGDYVKFQFRLLSVSKVRHPFQEDIGMFLDVHQKALSNGLVDIGMASGLIYANCYFAAGLPLNALLGSKLLLYEQRAIQMNQDSFRLMFRVTRQFILNLMGKSGGILTAFKGVAFNEEETLSKLEGNSKKMALRDVSTFRLQLAYIFNDELTMKEMLERLKTYPLADLSVARGFLRVTFIGLAALLLGRNNKNAEYAAIQEYLEMGQNVILRYRKLVRAGGSANALPAYLCVKAAMKPTKASYDKAIKACSDASMIHLEAMMCERCGELMNTLEDQPKFEEYMSKALCLYSDWGAFAKINTLKEQYKFLSDSKLKRWAPTSVCSSSRAGWDKPGSQAFGL